MGLGGDIAYLGDHIGFPLAGRRIGAAVNTEKVMIICPSVNSCYG